MAGCPISTIPRAAPEETGGFSGRPGHPAVIKTTLRAFHAHGALDRGFRISYNPPASRIARAFVAPSERGFAGYAQVAQLVEHATENRSVGGSIPPLGTIHSSHS